MKEVFKKLALVFLGILISMLVFEIILHILDYPYMGCEEVEDVWENRMSKFDEDLGWSFIHDKFTRTPEGDFIINEEGYRTYSLDKKTNLSKPIIMIVGGSFTFGAGVPYYNQTFTYKIEKLLNDKFEVLNFGVSAYGTDQSYITVKRYFDKYKPVAVVYTFISGHSNRNMDYDRRKTIKCARFLGTKPLFGLENDELRLVKKPLRYEEYDSPIRMLNFFRDYNPFKEEPKYDTDSLMKALLSAMIDYTKRHNSRMYFINFDEVPSDSIKDFLLENGYDILDMSPFLSKSEIPWMLGGFPPPRTHPNEYGNTLVAEKFVEKYGDGLIKLALEANYKL